VCSVKVFWAGSWAKLALVEQAAVGLRVGEEKRGRARLRRRGPREL
jgi:hypothetical protein